METLFTKLCMLIVVALALQIHGNKGCLEQERIALLAIKSFIINATVFDEDVDEHNRTVESWVDDRVSDCCDWYRVECSTTTGRVMNLSLSRLLQGSTAILNFSLFQPLEQLRSLDLSYNYFTGWVVSRAHHLKQLKILNLGGNYFNSSILSYLTTITPLTTLILSRNNLQDFNHMQGGGLGNLRNLEYLDLSGASINVSLQELGGGLANLRNLEFLDLSGNMMSGSLQNLGICKLKNLIELDLRWNNFEGHLPPCVVNNLTILQALDLSSNKLTGNIPSLNLMKSLVYLSLQDNNFEGLFSFGFIANLSKLEIFKLSIEDSTLQVLETENFLQQPPSQLKVLDLSKCNLHGIPSFLMYQHSLEFIDLSYNKLVGMFPTWILQNNTRLQFMYLINNSLSGILQLPNSTHDLLQLRISNNNLNGQLPMNIGVILPRLMILDLSKNSFEGYIPWSMGEMKSLNILDLSSNNFSGELPKVFVSGCSSLGLLKLSNNNFHGEIFPQFMNMTQLQLLHLDNNRFSGKIKDGLWKARFLRELDLSNNSFSGQIPDWIGNFSGLQILVLSNNHLEGGVPVQLSNLGRLSILDISENRLSGSMASSFNLSSSSVEKLCMQKNALNGSIPNAFLRNTFILDLRDNEFSGSIPIPIDEVPFMFFLLLGGNHLEGLIPHELCKIKSLSILDLSRNRFNGTIPSCFTNILIWVEQLKVRFTIPSGYSLSMGTTGYYVASYNFTLAFQQQVYSYAEATEETEIGFVSKNRYESYKGSPLQYMLGIDLSSNELTGDIPTDIGNLQQIKAMNLSHNSLTGSIPESFSNLTNIESLDLSHNKLSGRIPPQLTQLNSLGTFNVSFNNLSGLVPDNWQFGSFVESSYGGNPGLCGPQIKRSCEPTTPPATPSGAQEEEEDESAIDMVSFYWSLFAAYVTTIMAFVLILWLNSYWRKQWFCFIDACIISSYCWILRNVFHRYDDI